MAIVDKVLGWNVSLYRLVEKADNTARSSHLGAAAVTVLLNELENHWNSFMAPSSFVFPQSREQRYDTTLYCRAVPLIRVQRYQS
jgi:hypothetical protein